MKVWKRTAFGVALTVGAQAAALLVETADHDIIQAPLLKDDRRVVTFAEEPHSETREYEGYDFSGRAAVEMGVSSTSSGPTYRLILPRR